MKILVCNDQPEAAEKVRGMVEELAASIIQTPCKKKLRKCMNSICGGFYLCWRDFPAD